MKYKWRKEYKDEIKSLFFEKIKIGTLSHTTHQKKETTQNSKIRDEKREIKIHDMEI